MQDQADDSDRSHDDAQHSGQEREEAERTPLLHFRCHSKKHVTYSPAFARPEIGDLFRMVMTVLRVNVEQVVESDFAVLGVIRLS